MLGSRLIPLGWDGLNGIRVGRTELLLLGFWEEVDCMQNSIAQVGQRRCLYRWDANLLGYRFPWDKEAGCCIARKWHVPTW